MITWPLAWRVPAVFGAVLLAVLTVGFLAFATPVLMLAGAVGVIAAAAPAGAQDRYHEVVTGPDGTETVIVEAPYDRIHHYADGTATLSRAVSYSDLDLTTRLMRYPLSYMVYTEAFDGLAAEVKDAVYRRLFSLLRGRDRHPRYAHPRLPAARAAAQILRETTDVRSRAGARVIMRAS